MVVMASTANRSSRYIFLLAFLLPTTGNAGDWKFTPTISVSERYSDNVSLSTNNPESSFLTEITPGFNLRSQGGKGSLSVDYGLQALLYTHDSGANGFNNRLAAKMHTELLDDSFLLDASANISQQSTSLTGATGTENYNTTGNRSETRSASLTPSWRTRFGNTAQFETRWQLTYTDSDNGTLSGTTGNSLSLSLNSGSAFNRIPWGLSYRLQNSDGNASADRNSSLSGSLGYIFSPKTRLTLSLGKDSNNGTTSGFNNASGIFWNLGFSWVPSTRTNLEVTTGHRYSGNSYGLNFTHRTRKTTWSLKYSEDITQTFGQVNGEDTYLCQGLQMKVPAGTSPDPALCPAPFLINRFYSATQLVNDTTLNKAWVGSATYQTGKSTYSLSLNKSRRELLTSGTRDDSSSLGGSWTLQLGPRMTSSLSLTASHAETTVSQSDDWTLAWVLSRQLSRQTTGSLDVRRVERDSGSTSGAYKENSVSARVNMSF